MNLHSCVFHRSYHLLGREVQKFVAPSDKTWHDADQGRRRIILPVAIALSPYLEIYLFEFDVVAR